MSTQDNQNESQDIDEVVGALIDVLAAALAEKHCKQALELSRKEKSPSS